MSDSLANAKFVSGFVPDWNQPYSYGPASGPSDPAAGIVNQWNAWCAPSSGANLAGHWADARGVPVADTTAFPGSTVIWAADASWHDYEADGFARPPVQNGPSPLPASPTDIGWYMDTNRGEPLDAGGTMGGYFLNPPNDVHAGTYLKDIHIGLQNYLNSRCSLSGSIFWRTGTQGKSFYAGTNAAGATATNHLTQVSAFNEVKTEIDSNRTLIVCFTYWNPTMTPSNLPPRGTSTESTNGGTYFTWGSTTTTNETDEDWNYSEYYNGLGHAVTVVGYIPHNDPDDPGSVLGVGGPTDWVIVHDNWASTPRNVIIPFQYNGAWVANTTAVPWPSAAKLVTCLVPDWNQPYTYGPLPNGPSDPAAGVPNQWNAWCAPSSAANLAGHWTDCFGAPVADTTVFPGSTVIWGVDPSWQDYLADGTTNRPALQVAPGPLPVNPTDIGWYMDTNRGQPLDGGGGLMGGFFLNPAIDVHVGTYLKDIHVGLGVYLTARFSQPNGPGWDTGTQGKQWAGGINALGNPAVIHPNEASAFGEVMQEINRNHTLILCFSHWAIQQTAFSIAASGTNTEAEYGGTYYVWPAQPPNTGDPNAEDELWNFYDYSMASNNLGHAVTCVGYIPANDPLDPIGQTDWVIVHDNWANTPRNVIIPYGSPGQFNVNWVANTTAEPSQHLSITNIQAVATNIFIGFIGIPSALHYLEWKSDITNSTWTTCVSNLAFVVGTMQVTNSVPAGTQQRFYRIRAHY